MANIYKINGSTLTGLADSVRAKTGESDPLTLADIKAYIDESGVCEAYACTYYDYDFSTVLYREPILAGGTTTFVGENPTKPTDENYKYKFSGWSKQQNGTASEDIFENIEENAKFYPVFIPGPKDSTVTFYASESDTTPLATVSVEYEGTAVYPNDIKTLSSGGMPFVGWSQSITNVTDDLSVYAIYASREVSEIADDWDTIIQNVENGTYATNYKIGQYKPLTVGSETIQMQIVGMYVDKTESGEYAHTSWMAKDCMVNTRAWNSSGSTSGYWKASEIRSYLQGDFLASIPDNVKSKIKTVQKASSIANGGADTHITQDNVWLASDTEVFNTFANGGVYTVLFNSNSARIKNINGSSTYWWLRSVYDSTYADRVYSSGSSSYNCAYDTRGVVPGFCI